MGTDEVVDAEVVEEEPVEHGTDVVAADFARPVITPDEAAQAAQELRQLIAKVLVRGKHYQTIRGRDVLLKAGAEELAKVFGMQTGYTELSATSIDGLFSASVKCTVSKGGLALAESYGFYDSSERKGANPNTVVKMAQKRAYVGAVMSATGTSELFTQDLEDATPAADRNGIEDRKSTAEERLLLKELFARKGAKTIIEAGDWLREQNGKADSQLWVARQVLALVLKPDPGEPELPPDPPLSEQAEASVSAADDDIPFDTEEPAPASASGKVTSYQVTMPTDEKGDGFTAAVVLDPADDHIIGTAPILRWSKGKHIDVLRAWVEKKGGEINGVS